MANSKNSTCLVNIDKQGLPKVLQTSASRNLFASSSPQSRPLSLSSEVVFNGRRRNHSDKAGFIEFRLRVGISRILRVPSVTVGSRGNQLILFVHRQIFSFSISECGRSVGGHVLFDVAFLLEMDSI